jgi:hypothetical protein
VQLWIVILATLAAMIGGFASALHTRRRPDHFWRVLAVGILATTPLMIGGYTWYDEGFIVGFLLGSHRLGSSRPKGAAHTVFLLFAAYMLFESLRGMLVLESLRKIRWMVFFLIVIWLYYRLVGAAKRLPVDKGLPYSLTRFGLWFHCVYVLWAVLAEATGVNRFMTQLPMLTYGYTDSAWAMLTPTAYAAFILIAILPAAIITTHDRQRSRRRIGWLTLLVIGITTLYYDSRVGGVYIAALLVVSLVQLELRRVIGLAAAVFAIFVFDSFVISIGGVKDFAYYLDDLSVTASAVWSAEPVGGVGRDVGRKAYLEAVYPALNESYVTLAFGHGFRVAGYAVAPYVDELFLFYGLTPPGEEAVGTEAITNLSVDTGIVGVVLTAALFVNAGVELVRRRTRFSLVLLTSLFMTVVWLSVINVIDAVLLYWVLMPHGLFGRLNEAVTEHGEPFRRSQHDVARRGVVSTGFGGELSH